MDRLIIYLISNLGTQYVYYPHYDASGPYIEVFTRRPWASILNLFPFVDENNNLVRVIVKNKNNYILKIITPVEA